MSTLQASGSSCRNTLCEVAPAYGHLTNSSSEGEAVADAKVIGLLEGAAQMLVCIPEQLSGSTCLPEVAWIEGGLKAYAMAS